MEITIIYAVKGKMCNIQNITSSAASDTHIRVFPNWCVEMYFSCARPLGFSLLSLSTMIRFLFSDESLSVSNVTLNDIREHNMAVGLTDEALLSGDLKTVEHHVYSNETSV